MIIALPAVVVFCVSTLGFTAWFDYRGVSKGDATFYGIMCGVASTAVIMPMLGAGGFFG